MQLILLAEARQQFEYEDEDAWRRTHRDAFDLFTDEFERTLERMSLAPELGQPYRQARGKWILRWLMPKTRCHVYYVVDQVRGVIEIHSVWGARRGRGPHL